MLLKAQKETDRYDDIELIIFRGHNLPVTVCLTCIPLKVYFLMIKNKGGEKIIVKTASLTIFWNRM